MSKAAFTAIKTLVDAGAIRPAINIRQYAWKDFVTMVNEGAAGLLPEPLTPAQEHADELLAVVRHLCNNDATPTYLDRMRALRDKIDPPKPVTLDEAINALHEMADYTEPKPGALDAARAVLRRFNKGEGCKVFATARGETPVKPLPIPDTGNYGPGCVNHLSVQRYKALLSVGWTDTLLIQHGLMK